MSFKKIVFNKYFVGAWILSLISIVGILLVRSYLPPLIPLFYGKPVGIEELAPRNFLFIVPVMSITISIINLMISKSAKDDFTKKILAVGSLIVSLITSVTVVKIILLVGFF